jgi:S-DNA-T family DNA segregation ATPase FtsK/SpoIIIE
VNYLRFLTPTENKRLNELIGFLCITASVLTALALISYSPTDASWNVSSAPEGAGTGNWIGPAGAYGADLLFQVFGFAAFLLPMGLSVLGWRWIRSHPMNSQFATLAGYGLLLLSLPSLLTLWHFPDVRGTVPPGGMLGSLVSGGLRSGFNPIGANLVAMALLLTALFMTTRFSFSGAHAWASGPKGPIGAVEKLGVLQKVQARWHAWRGTREQERLRKRLAETRLSGRKPVTNQSVAGASTLNENSAAIELEDESDVFKSRDERE